jgi:hypothetical protein
VDDNPHPGSSVGEGRGGRVALILCLGVLLVSLLVFALGIGGNLEQHSVTARAVIPTPPTRQERAAARLLHVAPTEVFCPTLHRCYTIDPTDHLIGLSVKRVAGRWQRVTG